MRNIRLHVAAAILLLVFFTFGAGAASAAAPDTTGPVVRFAGNARVYLVDQSVRITCSVRDAASRVAFHSCRTGAITTDAARLYGSEQTRSAVARDAAGNWSSASTTFVVRVTPPSLCRLTRAYATGSRRFARASKPQQAVATATAGTACQQLPSLTGRTKKAQRAAALVRYRTALASLSSGTWITTGERSQLTRLAGELLGPAAAPSAPTAPTNLTVTAVGDAQASLLWTPPQQSNRAAVSRYIITARPGGATRTVSCPCPTLRTTFTGLDNGVGYRFTATAVNAAGRSAATPATAPVTPQQTSTSTQPVNTTPVATQPTDSIPPVDSTPPTDPPQTPTAPGIATAVSATSGPGAAATVSFAAPTNPGGSPITGYIVTSDIGGVSATGSSSPIVVSALTPGSTYTFTVRAINAHGTSAASAPSAPITIVTAPSAPATVTATLIPDSTDVSVSFTTPASNGGSPITSYTVTANSDDAPSTSTSGTSSPITVPDLEPNTTYTFTVRARNAIGLGVSSVASGPLLVPAFGRLPGAPTITGVLPGNQRAVVNFAPPADTGDLRIRRYEVIPSSGAPAVTGTSSPIIVPDLANGTSYTFTVRAINAVGPGAASASSSAVTARTVPEPPANALVPSITTSPSIRVVDSPYDGGSPITEYRVVGSPGNITATGMPPFIDVTGLEPGVEYTFSVTAVNAAGASAPRITKYTPLGPPHPPTITSITTTDTTATVHFTPPTNTGGGTLIGYQVWGSMPSRTEGTSSPITITGLEPGSRHYFMVRMLTQGGGYGDWSEIAYATIAAEPAPAPPSAEPTITSITTTQTGATIHFNPPTNLNGQYILFYELDWALPGIPSVSASQFDVTGLSPGTRYAFRVRVRTNVAMSDWSEYAYATTAALPPAPLPPATPLVWSAQYESFVQTQTGHLYNETNGEQIDRITGVVQEAAPASGPPRTVEIPRSATVVTRDADDDRWTTYRSTYVDVSQRTEHSPSGSEIATLTGPIYALTTAHTVVDLTGDPNLHLDPATLQPTATQGPVLYLTTPLPWRL